MRTLLMTVVLLAGTAASAQSAAGIEWKAPESWTVGPQRAMRVATYSIPAAKGDAEPAELAVFFFGTGQGGGVDANIQRWIAQFEQPDGKPSDKAAKTAKQKVAGLPVTTIDLTGTYTASMGPMNPGKEKKPGFRLLGAIVEAPEGSVFFKMTGPEKTVAAAQKQFQAMIKGIKTAKAPAPATTK